MDTTIKKYNEKIKSIKGEIFTKETTTFGFIFFLLSIVFFYYVRGPLINSLFGAEVEIHVFVIIPSNLESVLYWAVWVSILTPYLIFIYRREYGSFIVGFSIPSILVSVYTWYLGCFQLEAIYEKWSLYYLIPPLILIYFLRRSKNLKEDLLSIMFFIFLNEILSLYSGIAYLGNIYLCISFTVFGTLYLILLAFAVEKIAKIKIFRRSS